MAASTDPVIVLYLGMNLLSCLVFVMDKVNARRNNRRTPERTLLLLAALGPFGALCGMVLFRHKTRHAKFLLVWIFALVHAAVLYWLFSIGRL